YFVAGVEGSLCSDAPTNVWFVICGFAVVSVSLFVVAVSFRLLLQQKEEGLYRVVFEEDLSGSCDTLSDDSFPLSADANRSASNSFKKSKDRGGMEAGWNGRKGEHA
ncbi:unnamed protein product, partial [Laminaria digitata]